MARATHGAGSCRCSSWSEPAENGITAASRVLVDAHDDNKALTLTVTASHVDRDAHIVVALRDMTRARNFAYLDHDVKCVQWHSPRMVTEELQDPGIADVYADLMSHGGRNTYSTRLPAVLADAAFGQVQTGMGRDLGATVLAVQHDGKLLSAGWETPLPAESVLYYVSDHRLSPEEIAGSCAS